MVKEDAKARRGVEERVLKGFEQINRRLRLQHRLHTAQKSPGNRHDVTDYMNSEQPSTDDLRETREE